MKILHTADIHLQAYGDERWQALEQLIAIAQQEGVELFIISGDLFDRGVDAEKLRPDIRSLFSDTGLQVCLIPGNHDSDSFQPRMYFGADVHILRDPQEPFVYRDVTIWGLPFRPLEAGEILKQIRSLAPRMSRDTRHILLYHGELLDSFFSRSDFGQEGELRYMPVRLSYFEGLTFDYVLAGHFHRSFEVWDLKGGGYFCYPGSPLSITRRETGPRYVNLFELGRKPHPYPLATPHFAELTIILDPFRDMDPVKLIKEKLQSLPKEARPLLTVTGFFNSKAIGKGEQDLAQEIKRLAGVHGADLRFRDIQKILEDDLFQGFLKKLAEKGYDEDKQKEIREIAIRGMMEARG